MKIHSLLLVGFNRIAVPTAVLLVALYAHAHASLVHSLIGGLFVWPQDELTQSLGVFRWVAGAWLLERLVTGSISATHRARHAGASPPRILLNFVAAIFYFLATVAMLHFELGSEITGLVATSGVLTVVVGVAIRDMIADFFRRTGAQFRAAVPDRGLA